MSPHFVLQKQLVFTGLVGLNFIRTPRGVIAIAVVLVVVGYAAYVAFSSPRPVAVAVPSMFSVNGKTFAITSVATDPAERVAGLMNTKVTSTTIMLFVFPSAGVYGFWMLDTNTSLDMIWVSASGGSGHVVYVHADGQPCYNQLTCPTYTPSSPANFVFEAEAGFAQANGIQVGMAVQFEAETNVQVS